jgi:CheY-like chemotaxis protein
LAENQDKQEGLEAGGSEAGVGEFRSAIMTWPETSSGASIRILLVEDDDGDAKAVERTFFKTRNAKSIVRAVDGIEALEILQGTDLRPRLQKPYLLLVDLNLPRMNGLELVAAIREDPQLRDTVVFVLTTSNRQQDKNAAYALKVAGYIPKEKAGENFQNLFNLVDSYRRIVELP